MHILHELLYSTIRKGDNPNGRYSCGSREEEGETRWPKCLQGLSVLYPPPLLVILSGSYRQLKKVDTVALQKKTIFSIDEFINSYTAPRPAREGKRIESIQYNWFVRLNSNFFKFFTDVSKICHQLHSVLSRIVALAGPRGEYSFRPFITRIRPTWAVRRPHESEICYRAVQVKKRCGFYSLEPRTFRTTKFSVWIEDYCLIMLSNSTYSARRF